MKNTILTISLLLMIALPGAAQSNWYADFQDETLTRLVGRAIENNYDLLGAMRRVEAAQQASRITRAGYSPTLGISAGWNGQRTSADMTAMSGHATTMNYFNLGLTMNWEVDVFGRIREQAKADRANYAASVADYEAMMVTVGANVAKAYFQLRMAQQELSVADEIIDGAEELLRIARTRYEVGLVPSVDVIQAENVVMQTRATLPGLRADVIAAKNQLSILVAEPVDSLDYLDAVQSLPHSPLPPEVDDPMALIVQRPDIVEAQRQLDATASKIGIARKDYMPTLSVQGGLGTEAHRFTNLFGSGSFYYSVMPTLSWTIFDGLGREARIAQAKALFEAQLDEYNGTLQTAVAELNTARARWLSSVEQCAVYKKILSNMRKELTLQVDRYKQGLCDYTDVANAQTGVLQAENSVIESQAAQLAAFVTLRTSLGQ